MFGPKFQIGDEVVWSGKYSLPSKREEGPFVVIAKEDNNDPDACACGANLEDPYHYNREHCAELPSQWVNVRTKEGKTLLDFFGKAPARFASDWFRKQ